MGYNVTKQFKKWAFIVGVSTYDDEHFRNLDHATNHVREFKKLLEDSNEFEPIVYLSEEGDKDHKPTSGNIMIQYAKLLQKVRPNDLLIVYILSHGGIFERKKCIFPKNASKESKEILKRESIPLSYFLEEEISNYEPEDWKVFFFFDICQCHMDIKSHGDGDVEAAKKVLAEENKRNEELELEPMEINEEPSGIAQFFACSSNEEAFVFKKEGEDCSVFSFALLKA